MLRCLVLLTLTFAKRVTLHLEQLSPRTQLLHAGISFHDESRCMRFDFRPFCVDDTYLTATNLKDAFYSPHLAQSVAWGVTDRSWEEIVSYEHSHLCRRYVLGVYDCRHYTHEFALWSTGSGTPIWQLHELWQNHEKHLQLRK